ncbi:MAG: alpha/beta hydrolase [Anaerolineaceae bacterium]|nr:MAG: alpha/beta hydrolase [Anaerolineaceae bacterium]
MRSFEEIYADVPAEQREALRQFRADHPERTLDHDGTTWRYVVSGDDAAPPLLLLVGGLREADAAHANIAALSDTFRVITPSYPALGTMNALADGLSAILTHEGAVPAQVLAGSFGGMLAQIFIRRHPALVAKVVLSTTAVFDAASVERYRQALAMVEPLPDDEVAAMAKQMMFATMQPPPDKHAFYRAYLDELYSYRVDKAGIVSLYRALLDFADHGAMAERWAGDVLILESDDDATFDESIRARVRGLYPGASHYTFHGAGHSPATTQRELYFNVVKNFLTGGADNG